MRFTVSSTALSSRLQALARVISSKNTLPILDCFLFQVNNQVIRLTASDGENTFITTLPTTECEGDGNFAINNKTILDAIKDLAEQPLTFDIDMESYGMRISYQNGVYNFVAQNAETFPTASTLIENATALSIDADTLLSCINRSLFATAQEDIRPVMNGLYFDLSQESLTIVATEGRMLVRNRLFSIKGDPASFILPNKPAQILKNGLPKCENDVSITFNDRNAMIVFDDFTLVCRLIEGRYPNYNAVIPQDNPNRIQFERSAMLSALKRVILFANAASNLVRFDFESGKLTMSSQDIDYSKSAETNIECQYEGPAISIGFKGVSMIDILQNIGCEDVILELADQSRAGLITPNEQPENQDVLMLIMPMLLSD
jgi:DNA polymerase-3 subunit beta